MKRFLILFSAIFLSLNLDAQDLGGATAQPDSTGQLVEAVGQNAGPWSTYYKFTVFIENGELVNLVYQDTEKFELHQQFLATLPQFNGLSSKEIDNLTYFPSSNRSAYTGVVVHRSGDDGITNGHFSLAMADVPPVDLVVKVRDLILRSVDDPDQYFGAAGNFTFEILPHQERGFAPLIPELVKAGVGVYEDEFESLAESYTDGWNVGRLVHVKGQDELDAKLAAGEVGPHTVIWTEEPLRTIPVVAGVITSVKLTPASHTVLLAQMYGIPVAYYADAASRFQDQVGREIWLSSHYVPASGYTSTAAEYVFDPSPRDHALMKEAQVQPAVDVKYEPENFEIRSPLELTRANVGAYGGKASQIGLIMRTWPENTVSEALAIPIGYSVRFFETAKVRDGRTLKQFIADKIATIADPATSDAQTDSVTLEIRTAIQFAAFPQDDLAKITQLLDSTFTGPSVKVRLRSSSNVEDGNEFNGAGLYDSEGLWLRGEKRGNVEKNLKIVISSLYTARAFKARRRFGIDESRIGMGILVHRAFLDEVGNGVIRTRRERLSEWTNSEIVTLLGDGEQVTHAQSEVAAEVVSAGESWSRVVQPYEGFSRERSLFPGAVYQELHKMMAAFVPQYGAAGEAVDIEAEFKLMKTAGEMPRIFIKQVRPVPRARVPELSDGSKFFVLSADRARLAVDGGNNTESFINLWFPKELELSFESFTERELRAGRVKVKRFAASLRGEAIELIDPSVKAVEITGDYPAVELKIDIPHKELNGLTLTLSVPLTTSGAVRSIYGGEISAKMEFKNLKHPVARALSVEGAFWQEAYAAYPPGTARSERKTEVREIVLTAGEGATSVTVTAPQAKVLGEGDGRSILLGEVTVQGAWKRDLKIPGSAIGYGANHHQGDESFLIDLFADPSLSARDRESLNRRFGRYLSLANLGWAPEADGALAIREDGKTRKLGTWRSSEWPEDSENAAFGDEE